VLSLLLQPEGRLRHCTDGLRQQAISDPAAAEVLPLIPAILLARFNDRPLQEICAMGGITLDDFTQSRAYREIFGLGEDRGRQEGRLGGRHEGRRAESCSVTLRLLARRCGTLSDATTTRIEALPLEQLEALAVGEAFSEGLALHDFTSPADLNTWLAAHD
jgi:predicted transposase YdaD